MFYRSLNPKTVVCVLITIQGVSSASCEAEGSDILGQYGDLQSLGPENCTPFDSTSEQASLIKQSALADVNTWWDQKQHFKPEQYKLSNTQAQYFPESQQFVPGAMVDAFFTYPKIILSVPHYWIYPVYTHYVFSFLDKSIDGNGRITFANVQIDTIHGEPKQDPQLTNRLQTIFSNPYTWDDRTALLLSAMGIEDVKALLRDYGLIDPSYEPNLHAMIRPINSRLATAPISETYSLWIAWNELGQIAASIRFNDVGLLGASTCGPILSCGDKARQHYLDLNHSRWSDNAGEQHAYLACLDQTVEPTAPSKNLGATVDCASCILVYP